MAPRDSLNPEIEGRVRARAAEVLERDPGELLLEPLPGHASARAYVRVRAGALRSILAMVLPPEAKASEEASHDDGSGELPFLVVQRVLDGLGVRVPAVYLYAPDDGLLLLEDLGDRTLEEAVRDADAATRARHYGAAIDTLAFMRRQAEIHPAHGTLPWTRTFDEDLLRWELDHFREWLLEAHAGARLSPSESRVVAEAFDRIARALAGEARGLTHRDYQSRNLLLVQGEIALIDFQDALQGPIVYDLVALLRDSYVTLPREEVDALLTRWEDAYRSLGGTPPERATLEELFDLQTVQRKLKDAGRFVYIDRVKHNPSFLPSIAPSLAYAREALSRLPEYADLHEVLAAHVPELAP